MKSIYFLFISVIFSSTLLASTAFRGISPDSKLIICWQRKYYPKDSLIVKNIETNEYKFCREVKTSFMECQWIDNSRFIWLDDKNQAYIVNIGKNIEKRFPELDGAILNDSSILLDKKLYYFKVTSPTDSDSQTTLFCYNFESAETEKMLLPFGFLNISVTKKDVTELYASADSRIYRINLVSKEVLMILNDNELPGDIGDGPINYLPQMDYLIFSLFLNNEKKSCIYYYNFKNNKLCRVDALSGYIFPHFAPNLEFFYAYKEHSDSEWKKFLMKDYFKQHLRD